MTEETSGSSNQDHVVAHRGQELKKPTSVTGPGETSHSIEDDSIGGREAGGNTGTGGVGSNDVGGGRASKQPQIEK